MQSYPFTSQVTYDEQGLPLYDRAVNSEFLRDVFKQYFSDGVFYSGNAACLQVAADTGMQVKVSPGACHIQGAMGIEYYQRTLVVQAAGAQDRIDTVVARLDLSVDARKIDLYVRQGTPGESPSAPALTRDSTTWELGLANLFIAKNTSRISQERITDTRLDTDRCGMVAAAVQPPFDTEEFFAQLNAAIAAHQQTADDQIADINSEWETTLSGINAEWDGWKDTTDEDFAAWFQHIKDQLDEDAAGHLQLQVDEINDTLATGAITTYQHRKIGTEHHLIGKGPNGKAQMTADVDTGDTVVLHDCADVDGLVIEGKTTQAGTGDPSPDNIRPIAGVGMWDQCVVLDGSEEWHAFRGQPGVFFTDITPKIAGRYGTGANIRTNRLSYTSTLTGMTTKQFLFQITSVYGDALRFVIKVDDSSTNPADAKAEVSANPIIVWYQSVNYSTHAGPWYTVVELSQDPYRAVGFELAQPLFDGDTLQVNVPSGCDQMIVLDGSETWIKSSNVSNAYFAGNVLNNANSPINDGSGPEPLSECKAIANHTIVYNPITAWTSLKYYEFSVNDEQIGVRIPGFSTAEEFQTWLADNPLAVFYRSADYTPEKDIPVVLEKHLKGLIVINGENNDMAMSQNFDNMIRIPVDNAKGGQSPVCDRYTGTTAAIDGAIYIDNGFDPALTIIDSRFADLETAKSILAAEPATVVYELATPVDYARLYDGTTLPAYMGTEDFGAALDGEPVSGKWLTFTQDGAQINFRGGGGLSSSKLAAANTAPGDVRTGKKFFAGDKTIKTGTLPVLHMGESHQINRWQNSMTKEVFIQANTIPEGIYESDGNTWSPQINIPAELFGNAAASQVLAGITFTSENGAKSAGTMPNQGAKTAALNAGGSYTIPAGYHNGSGKVTANSLASQTDANAADGEILTGKTAWVKGVKRTGTMPNRGAPNQTLGIGGSYNLSAGYYSGGKISAKGSFGGSGSSGDKSGSYAEIYRNESNVTREIQARSHASASINGKTVTITVHAEAYQRANDIPSLSGTKSSVDYSFSFTIS